MCKTEAVEKLSHDKAIEILKQLYRRITSIQDIYKPVVQCVKRMEKEGINNDIKKLIDSFIAESLPAKEFGEKWRKISMEQSDPDYSMLARHINSGEIILFLESGIFQPSFGSGTPRSSKDSDPPGRVADLDMGSYLSFGFRRLFVHISRFATPPDPPPMRLKLPNLLANIQKPIIIILSDNNDSLEKEFEKNDKKFVIISHLSYSRKVSLKYSDKNEANETNPKYFEDLSKERPFEKGYSLICKIEKNFFKEEYSFLNKICKYPSILSGKNFFLFSRCLRSRIPPYLTRRFFQRCFLFLGHDQEEWREQLSVNTHPERTIHRNEPAHNEDSHWKDIPLEAFVDYLFKAMIELRREADKKKFDVFLCHNSKDKSSVKKIGEELKKRGLRPWLDEWELRPGFPWQKILEEQIETVRSVAVFVGENGFGPWQDDEQRAFIQQFKKRECPVIPVILKDCTEDPELPPFLEGMTNVDFREHDPDPMYQLIWGATGNKITGKKQ